LCRHVSLLTPKRLQWRTGSVCHRGENGRVRSVEKMALPGEDHGDAGLVGGGDHLIVAQ
jgi:hypothetical protein